jgi:hypothetical protein
VIVVGVGPQDEIENKSNAMLEARKNLDSTREHFPIMQVTSPAQGQKHYERAKFQSDL